MPASVTYTCDRDRTNATTEGLLAPAGWVTMSCSQSNENGGVGTRRLVLCPTCSADLATWMGKTIFVPLPQIVPTETKL